jgi:hypothetical protein
MKMQLGLRTALLFLAIELGVADTYNASYKFGACYEGKRDLFYGMKCPPSKQIPCEFDPHAAADDPSANRVQFQVQPGMSCKTNCEAGFYLDVDLRKKQSKCKECPQNYYSVGGGSLYNGQTQLWRNLPGEFYTDCVVQHVGDPNWYHGDPGTNRDCSPWVSEANGTMISSGDNSANKTGGNFKTVSILYLNANFVKDGNVTYRFKVEGEADPNFIPGVYNPMYDGMYFVEDVNLRTEKISNTGWVQMTLQIEKGSHTLKWEYEKDMNLDVGADRAWIKDIQVLVNLLELSLGMHGRAT